MPLIPTFQINLSTSVLPGLVTIGKFDGSHPSLACATSPDNILIHSPHLRDSKSEHELRQLSVNRQISALTSGDLGGREVKRDTLLVGTLTNLLAYDVESNSDLFYKDVPDGVNALTYGISATSKTPVAVVGGNSSIQGFDHDGKEAFWTVTADNVTCLAIRESPKDGKQELMVGSADHSIRILQGEEVISEVSESHVVTGLATMRGGNYGYSLENGTIGVYNQGTRVWHAKSKHKPLTIAAFDLDGDGADELITGWSHGRLEVRHETSGDLIYKDKFAAPVARVLVADYRMDKRDQIIACATDGEVRGYLQATDETKGNLMDVNKAEQQWKQLSDRKQEIINELRMYEASLKQAKAGQTTAGVVPASTRLSVSVKPNRTTQSLTLTLSTNNDTLIKMVMMFSDTLFKEESMVVYPEKPGSTINVQIKPEKPMATDLLIKAVVGYRSSSQDHVFEVNYPLPRFVSFMSVRPREINPTSYLQFLTSERVNRVVLWMNQSFNLEDKANIGTQSNVVVSHDSLQAGFVNVRDGTQLLIRMTPDPSGSMQVQIRTDNIDLAGDIVQDLCKYLKISDLETVAEFPEEMKVFGAVLERVEEYNAIRLKLSADIADSANLIKALAIKAEDARILNDFKTIAEVYNQLHSLNRELLGEYTKRANNHEALLAALKEVNQMIQKAAKLRVGEFKNRVVAACRKAIKGNHIQSLFKIIQTGQSS